MSDRYAATIRNESARVMANGDVIIEVNDKKLAKQNEALPEMIETLNNTALVLRTVKFSTHAEDCVRFTLIQDIEKLLTKIGADK